MKNSWWGIKKSEEAIVTINKLERRNIRIIVGLKLNGNKEVEIKNFLKDKVWVDVETEGAWKLK